MAKTATKSSKPLFCAIAICILVLLVIGCVLLHNRFTLREAWAGNAMPTALNTEWTSEDRCLQLSTYQEYDSYQSKMSNGQTIEIYGGSITEGTLSAKGKTIPVYAEAIHDGTLFIWLNNGEYTEVYHNRTNLEAWKAIDYSETDTQVIFTMEIVGTTYFEIGQTIKLIYKKQ